MIAKSGTLTATASVTVLPATPKALTATAGTHKVNLKWDSATADKTYRVYRQDATGTFTMIASGLTATSFADSNVITGVTYQYYVTAVSVAGIEGSPSSTVSAAAR